MRTICIAYKNIDGSEDFNSCDNNGVYDIEKFNLTMVALIAIKDVLRQEVKNAVADCKSAGIKVTMVTGDDVISARAIARECGIIDEDNPNSLIMEGKEFQLKIGGIVCSKCLVKKCDCPRTQLEALIAKKQIRIDTIANKQAFNEFIDNLDVLARSRPEDKYALVTGLMEK